MCIDHIITLDLKLLQHALWLFFSIEDQTLAICYIQEAHSLQLNLSQNLESLVYSLPDDCKFAEDPVRLEL
jgi:hypothetical protein